MIDVASFWRSWGVFRDLTPLKTPAAALETVLNMTAKRVGRERTTEEIQKDERWNVTWPTPMRKSKNVCLVRLSVNRPRNKNNYTVYLKVLCKSAYYDNKLFSLRVISTVTNNSRTLLYVEITFIKYGMHLLIIKLNKDSGK